MGREWVEIRVQLMVSRHNSPRDDEDNARANECRDRIRAVVRDYEGCPDGLNALVYDFDDLETDRYT